VAESDDTNGAHRHTRLSSDRQRDRLARETQCPLVLVQQLCVLSCFVTLNPVRNNNAGSMTVHNTFEQAVL
jgi:hypothetical protein